MSVNQTNDISLNRLLVIQLEDFMGEASRRKKLDPNYGKVPSLSTPSLKEKHSEKIFQELLEQFKVEFSTLLTAETIPENYQTVTEQVRLWLGNKLLTYREPERSELAKLLFFTLVEVGEDVSFSPLLTSCIFKAVKDYLTPRELQVLLDSLDKNFSWESQSDITDLSDINELCAQFAYEEMTKDIKLSLAVE